MLEGLVRGLIEDGHEVTVLCASGGYAGEKMLKTETLKTEKLNGTEEGAAEIEEKKELGRDAPATDWGGTPKPLETPKPLKMAKPSIIRIGATRFGRRGFVGKLMDYASYYLGVAWKLAVMQPRPDRVVALTTPPFLSVVARAFSRLHGGDHAHWVMDLYPDVMTAHGMLKDGGAAQRLLACLAGWGFGGRRCAVVLTLGPDMAARTQRLMTAGAEKIAWVPLWGGTPVAAASDGADVRELRRARGWGADETVVMYSGNMGLGHRFGEILAAARELTDERFRFVFFGDGKRRREIQGFADGNPGCRVELRGYAPASELAAHLMSADVHVASLDPAWTGTMVPSKLQGVFAVGKPLIFIGSDDSSIGRWVAESGGGWVVAPDDVAGLVAALEEARDPEMRAIKGAAARDHAIRHFDREMNVAQIAGLLTAER